MSLCVVEVEVGQGWVTVTVGTIAYISSFVWRSTSSCAWLQNQDLLDGSVESILNLLAITGMMQPRMQLEI